MYFVGGKSRRQIKRNEILRLQNSLLESRHTEQSLLLHFFSKYNFFSFLFLGNNIKIEPSPTEAVTISPTSVTLTWKNDTAGVTSTMENGQMSLANQTGGNSTYSSPGSDGTSGDTTLGKMSSSQERS